MNSVFIFLIAAVVFIVNLAAEADDNKCKASAIQPLDNISEYADYLRDSKNQQRSLFNKTSWMGSSPNEAQSCNNTYSKLLEDNKIDIHFVFGYHDTMGSGGVTSTIDQRYFSDLFAALTRECSAKTRAVCGFTYFSSKSYENVRYLEKIVNISKNGKLQPMTIAVTMAYSSASSSDSKNLNSSTQKKYSQNAEDLFFGGIKGDQKSCEICVYYGHARAGGGPDFSPVPLDWRDSVGEPNYSIFKKKRPGYLKMLYSLRDAVKKPSLVGIYGCRSRPLFWKEAICLEDKNSSCQKTSLANFKDQTGFIVSNELSCPQNNGAMIGSLFDMIVNFKCRSDFDETMGSLRKLPEVLKEDYVIEGNFL
ncbi:MAG: hypothetical protein AB7F64_08440 [Gammaproteobacteria bacterium]